MQFWAVQQDCLGVAISGLHQGPADLHAQVVPTRLLFGQTEQAAASSTTDVQMDRLLRALKQLLR